ncbi:unnamed protein product [Allacma fusca]|uniref:TrmE-type G domain-containing protein n=1 Tax=Allacma fusca TaxID=39272 RepID=A0A8J2L8A4_9HEXA|nr:unnamed protein product [Allacma fusca]
MFPFYLIKLCKHRGIYFANSLFRPIFRRNFAYGSLESTIYALATGGVRSAVAVVRVSGPKSQQVLQEIGQFRQFPLPRVATVKRLYDISGGSLIDHAMVLWFPGPKSYTGEDSCEFHVHGGPAVIHALLRNIGSFKGCRMAEPGEFTKRAFLNGKMDLTEVDGLGDLISSETEMQRVQALNQMTGSLGKLYESWRNDIAKCLADVEAFIDFGEDENIEDNILENVHGRLEFLLKIMKTHLRDSRKGERLRTGVTVAILGKPNVGKSSLLNILCRQEAAIVSDIPGTTRDVLRATINVNGYPVLLADTAGLRYDPADIIETEGIRRALKEAQSADIIVLLVDLNDPKLTCVSTERQLLIQEEIMGPLNWNEDMLSLVEERTLIVGNKLDLDRNKQLAVREDLFNAMISCKTSEGFDQFLSKLSEQVSTLCADPKSEEAYITHERYRSHLENCVLHLEEYLQESRKWSSRPQDCNIDFALQSVPLKNAMNSIGCITGHFGTEDILDIIFRDFCIGK